MSIDTIPPNMLACQVVEYNAPYEIHQIPTPDPKSLGPHHLLVKIAVASLCHTDGMVAAGTFSSRLPQTASHEGTGVIVAVGSSITDFKVGDRVMCGLPVDRCGKCLNCKGPEDERQYCNKVKGYLGVTIDGCFAEYVVADGRESVKVPDKVSFETAAPLACAGCTVYRGVLQAKVVEGRWLGIVGSGGGLGHLGIQFAKAKGVKVVGVDARDEGIALSKEVGADIVVDARKGKEEIVKQVMQATGGEGCDATINVSDAKSAAALACAITRMHGKMVQIAQPDEVSVPFAELIFRDVKIEGSLICSRQQAQDMLGLVAEKGITVKTNIFRGLQKIPELVEYAHGGKMQGKGVVIVDEEAVRESKHGGGAIL